MKGKYVVISRQIKINYTYVSLDLFSNEFLLMYPPHTHMNTGIKVKISNWFSLCEIWSLSLIYVIKENRQFIYVARVDRLKLILLCDIALRM